MEKKSNKNQSITDTKDSDSVSLSYTEDNNNTFDSVSEDSNLYIKPVSEKINRDDYLDDSMVKAEDKSSELYEIEESSKNDQTQQFDRTDEKPSFSFEKDETVADTDILAKNQKSNFGFSKKKNSYEDDFTRPTIAKDVSNLLKINKESRDPRSRSSVSDSSVSESSFETKQKKLPIIGALSIKKQYQVISSTIILSLLVIGFGAFQYVNGKNKESLAQQAILKTRGDLQKLDNSFSSATIGKSASYDSMLENYEKINADFVKSKELNKGFSALGLEKVSKIENEIDKNLDKLNKNVEKVKVQSVFLRNTSARVTEITDKANILTDKVDRLALVYLQLGATQNELSNLYFMRGLLQNISSNASNLLLSDSSDIENSINLIKSRQAFKKSMTELYYGDESKNINPISFGAPYSTYSKLATEWIYFANTVDTVSKGSQGLLAVRALAPDTTKLINQLDSQISEVINIYDVEGFSSTSLGFKLIVLGLLILLVSAMILLLAYSYEKDNKGLLEKIENNKNQSSILRLLNEMIPLQDGDLTAHATVSDEITGAIADSINATVDSLGSLVRKIKDTSLTMRERTNEVNIISISMLKANEEQSGSIQGAAVSIKSIATAIRDISDKTRNSAVAAESSVRASQEGAEQVFSSVKSMQSIDSTMTETDRLMGKVQDSSKQISEIVELLSDITEGTSILALNATV
ncbi:MAG: methyl-accepting chemotaxis protein, partial [Candidatus Sericytochromatia bacterium]|nr:methyl-accepting chemotaxis protein [Candidatus Sericytochromatia bacterium]